MGEANKDEDEKIFWLGHLLIAVQLLPKSWKPTNWMPLHLRIFH